MKLIKFFFSALFIFSFITTYGANVQIINHSYNYNPSTGIIKDLTFTIKNNSSQGTTGFDVSINLFHEVEMKAIWVAKQGPFGGIGGNGSRVLIYPEIDLNQVPGLASGNYHLSVFIPAFRSEVYFLGPETETISFTSTATNIPVNANNNIKLYPNPVSAELNLEMVTQNIAENEVEVHDLNGKLIYTNSFPSDVQRTSIDFSHLPIGMYYLRLRSGNMLIERKIVKVSQ